MLSQLWRDLNEGKAVKLEGIPLRRRAGAIEVGDMYVAERNTGPQLLWAEKIVPYPTPENGLQFGGWIVPTTNDYAYDLNECIRVEEDIDACDAT